MGKAKKRSLHLGINDRFSNLSRTEAIKTVVEMLKNGDRDVYGLITLFGLSAEELLEAGGSYEAVKGLDSILL
ncbi:MAG: hypothetical protein E7Z93_04285 [Cyanobacteria bacterium SIG32]|nr:hypothetical protein [Cyanobacteria bacterium SIG32]